MNNNETKEDEYISCWSCNEIVKIEDIKQNDGFCPLCNQEIELDDH